MVQVLRSLFPEQIGASNVQPFQQPQRKPVWFRPVLCGYSNQQYYCNGTAGDLRIIEVLLLRLDEAGSQERINKVYKLKNSPALDVANAVSNFLRSERVVNQAAPGVRTRSLRLNQKWWWFRNPSGMH